MTKPSIESDPLAFPARGGEMGERTRAFDWSRTPVGPVAGWPQSLKIAVRIMLDSRYAMWLGWGPDFTFFYNDAYARMTLGPKHPWALGRSAREVWAEIWADIGPRAERVIGTGEATWDEGLLLFLERRGFSEETYHTFSYSPVPGDRGGVGGMLCVVTEDTERTIGERRLRTLRELAARTTDEARSAEDACQTAARTLADNPRDVPFALVYLLDDDAKTARLAGATGLPEGSPAAPPAIDLGGVIAADGQWPFRAVLRSGRAEVVADLERRFGPLPGGPWPEPAQRAVVLPVAKPGQARLAGFVVAGASVRRPLDDGYRGFLDLLAGQVATAVANARAYEEGRRRAEALAELDRAKTAFFSNVSHEFRTPLTLMLGPAEDALADADGALPPAQRERVEVIHRNGLRLQRLVNTLLDFSRIEAGRVRAAFEPTDLASFTTDLASNFRSACDRAGLTLTVDCPPLAEPVYVDRGMWEKVVLNLLSNAFKFTFEGGVGVSVRPAGQAASVRVTDTGTGIPAAEMPRLFDRFHRVENARGRTHEGSGIGLALVQELVRLHGGAITAESEVGRGTTFTVTLPFGSAHLPPEQVGGNPPAVGPTGATAFVEEALRWLPDASSANGDPRTARDARPSPAIHAGRRPRILVADDNADMRDYVARLLGGEYAVEAAADGAAALDAVRREPPDLVLSDVMMPRLDGFGLLRALRADPATVGVPVVLLSARAGEESRIEGMQAGADDYLVKPFSARELQVRVAALLQVARLRRAADEAVRASEERLRALVTATSDVVYRMSADWAEMRHLQGREFIPDTHEPSRTWLQKYIPPEDQPQVLAAIRAAVESRGVFELEHRVVRADGTVGWTFSRAVPLLDAGGRIVEWFGAAGDITARKRVEEDRERFFAVGADLLVVAGADGHFRRVSPACERTLGWSPAELTARPWADFLHPDDRVATLDLDEQVLRGREVLSFENRYRHQDGSYRWLNWRAKPYPAEGLIYAGATDVTERKLAEEAVRQSEAKYRALADAMPQIVWTAGPDGQIDYLNRRWTEYTGQPQTAGNAGWGRVLHPDDAPQANERWAASLRTGEQFEMEVRLLDRGTQAYRWHLIRTVAVRDGGDRVARWFGTATDIHGQKRAEESSRYLAEASAALARVVDYESTLQQVANLAVPYFADWAAVDVTADGGGFRRLAVAHQDPAKVRLAHELMRDYPPDPQAPMGVPAVFRTGKPEFVGEITDDMLVQGAQDDRHRRLVRSLGLKSYLCVPLVVAGNPLAVLTFVTAESGRTYTEADLALATDLAHRAAVAVENTRLYQALRDADRRKDEFLATLAHELRNPLAPIRNSLQVLKMPGVDAGTAGRSRDMMERQVHHLVRLVDDLLDVSRVMRGKIELRRERVDLATVVGRAVETAQPLVDGQGHRLSVSLPPEPLSLDADPVRLAQVVGNLLTNAAKYTEPGGRIEVNAGRAGDTAVLRVRDTGIGIATAMLPRIFELFVQADHAATKAQGGLGIGLTLVRNLVEMHGGTVEARSDGLGRGSEFVIRLPLADAKSRPVAPAAAAGANGGPGVRGRRVLVVDDNRDAADSLAALLRLQGHAARIAYDGPAGLAAAAEFAPDVVLLDLGMPGMDGYEVARRIRAAPGLRGVALAALTGWGQPEDRRRTAAAGFDHHLVKPVEPAALEKLLAGLRSETA